MTRPPIHIESNEAHRSEQAASMPYDPRNMLVILLRLVALHSFAVGVGLIVMTDAMTRFFFPSGGTNGFFRVQGGVFHIVMAVVYGLAATSVEKHADLIRLAILAKAMATVFLLVYFAAVNPLWVVLLSGMGDAAMGYALYALWARVRRQERAQAPLHSGHTTTTEAS